MGIRLRAIATVFRRNFAAYFGSPTGYVFIVIFIIAGSFLAFSSEGFFAANLADLATLNTYFHWLLVFFIPAVTMSVWADERKLGTDELLFTLPLRDIEIVVGKYLAAFGVYTVALVFALSHTLVLAWLGDPDWGLLTATYIGYWIMGGALIAVGMVASALTSHATVAFILGTTLCLAIVFTEKVIGWLPGVDKGICERIGVLSHFRSFALGIVALPDVLYFVMVGAVMLYINMVLIGRRHWRWGRAGHRMGLHYVLRAAALIVIAVAVSILAGRWADRARIDTTAEGLNTISEETVKLLKELPEDRPVYIQAYVSPEVPEGYEETRRDLLRVLKQFGTISGGRVVATVHDTDLYSDAALEAKDRFEIEAVTVQEQSEGRYGRREIFLGVAVTCGAEQEVIPFIEPGLSVEYELARSLRVVSGGDRRVIGVLRTDAQITGGIDMQRMRPIPGWPFVDELKKQYEVRDVSADSEVPDDVDVLIVALPSSLTQEQMDRLGDYLESGRPALLLVDPLPVNSPQLSPSLPKMPQGGMYGRRMPPGQKGDIDALLGRIGLSWKKDVVIWGQFNPVWKLRDRPLEFVFTGADAGGDEPAYNADEVVSRRMERMLLMYPGALRAVFGTTLTVTPLVRTGAVSGEVPWGEIAGMGYINDEAPHVVTPEQYILAAKVTGKLPAAPAPPSAEGEATEATPPRARSVNAIVIADLDMISWTFFNLRRSGVRDFRFDNIDFILNCVDYLAGDEWLIALRSRRPKYRPLSTIEARRRTFEQEKQKEEEDAEKEAKEELKQAQDRLDRKLEDLRKRTDIDERTRQTLMAELQDVEQNRFKSAKERIEARKDKRLHGAEVRMQRGIQSIENGAKLWAVVLPPLPAVLIGIVMFLKMWLAERAGTPLSRSMRRGE